MKPKKGDSIYIPTSIHLSRGSDDFDGGVCIIKAVKGKKGEYQIEVEERPGRWYNYGYLFEQQRELQKEFGKRKGRMNPDVDTPWIQPGDTVGFGYET